MTTNDQQPLRGGNIGSADIAETYTRLLEKSFAAFALDFRKQMGHPMTAREWSLAKLAYVAGFTDGVDEGIRALCEDEEPAP